MLISILIILANTVTAALCLWLAFTPKFRPISWLWVSLSVFNAAISIVNIVRIILV